MQITLTADEATALREILSGYVEDLRREIVHTDSHQYREMLRQRESLIDRLVGQLSGVAV